MPLNLPIDLERFVAIKRDDLDALAFGSVQSAAPVAEPAFTLQGSMNPTAAIASWFNRFREAPIPPCS